MPVLMERLQVRAIEARHSLGLTPSCGLSKAERRTPTAGSMRGAPHTDPESIRIDHGRVRRQGADAESGRGHRSRVRVRRPGAGAAVRFRSGGQARTLTPRCGVDAARQVRRGRCGV